MISSVSRRALLAACLLSFYGIGRASSFTDRLVAAAIDRTHHNVRYDGSYFAIPYPGGDVPSGLLSFTISGRARNSKMCSLIL